MSNLTIIRSLYRLLDVPALTTQEETFLANFIRVKNVTAAARMAGTTAHRAREMLDSNDGMSRILQYLAEQETYDFEVTKGMLNDMLMDAWGKTADATEQVGVIRELAKINGQYPGAEKQAGNVFNAQFNITQNPEGEQQVALQHRQIKDIQTLSDDQLAELAGNSYAQAMVEDKRPKKPPLDESELVYDSKLDMHVPIADVGKY